jgi:hypothetical protein
LREVERPTLADDPLVQILAADVAHREQSAVSVAGVADALDLAAIQILSQVAQGTGMRDAAL